MSKSHDWARWLGAPTPLQVIECRETGSDGACAGVGQPSRLSEWDTRPASPAHGQAGRPPHSDRRGRLSHSKRRTLP